MDLTRDGSTDLFLALCRRRRGLAGCSRCACRGATSARSPRAQGAAPLPEPVFGAMVALHTGVLVGGAALEVVVLHRPFVAGASASRRWRLVVAGQRAALVGDRGRWAPTGTCASWARLSLGVVTGGPYRFVRHPNYVAVFVELLALPLVHGAWLTALSARSCTC